MYKGKFWVWTPNKDQSFNTYEQALDYFYANRMNWPIEYRTLSLTKEQAYA